MKQAIKDVADWLASIDRTAKAESNPHRKVLLENYRQHVALEFNGRWSEFLGLEMAIEEPVYNARMGTEEVIIADGYKSVLNFYSELNDDTVLANHDERLAVAAWGLASYNTFSMWTNGRRVVELGFAPNGDIEPDGYYRVHRPIAMFWNYTPDAKLMGEDIFDVAPIKVDRIDASKMPPWDRVCHAVQQCLPAEPLRVKEAA